MLTQTQLPFELDDLPPHFTAFRKKVEYRHEMEQLANPAGNIKRWPQQIALGQYDEWEALPVIHPVVDERHSLNPVETLYGGSTQGLQHLEDYFASDQPATYKQDRNHLDVWSHSTKFSPWLANGSLSAKRVLRRLLDYEREVVANDSTYWIYFELLWREYFQWYALKHSVRLYTLKGVNHRTCAHCFYPERYRKWCLGNTPYPIVNACMKQLNTTGYMSNRGRQLAASCFVNELNMDWRYGAAYFEQQLIDYDVASNWGNWQYLAGVGADPRGKRHFDLKKQTRQYDPQQAFIKQWQGDVFDANLDSVDAADWPIG